MFIIRKKSRSGVNPYSGPTCDKAGVPAAHLYYSREAAQNDADELSKRNPVGFDVVEIKTDPMSYYERAVELVEDFKYLHSEKRSGLLDFLAALKDEHPAVLEEIMKLASHRSSQRDG